MAIYELLMRCGSDGTYKGSHCREWQTFSGPDGDEHKPGPVRPMTPEDFPALVADINGGMLARIVELEAELAEALEGPKPEASGGVTKLTLKRRLDDLGEGLWEKLKGALLTMPADVQDEWDLATEIEKSDPVIVEYGAAFCSILEISEEQMITLLTP